MRQLFTFLFLITFVGFINSQNLIVNGDFEQWDDVNNPTGWTKVEDIDQESTTIHGGTYSAKHTGGTSDLAQTISVSPNTAYKIIIWFYVETGDGTDCRIWSYWKSGGANITDAEPLLRPGGYFTSDPSWQKYEVTVTSPATADELYFELRTYSNAIVYYDDISVEVSTENVGPSISNIQLDPSAPTSSDMVTVSASITDIDGSVSSANLLWGTTSGSLGNSIAMNNTSGDTYEATIPAQADLTTVYYMIDATDDGAKTTESSEYDYTVFDAQSTILPYSEDFESGFNQVYTYSESGETKEWYINGGAANANGYNSGDVEIDWLILPAVNFDNYTGEKITFDTWNRFTTIDDDNYLKLLYSINYSGLGDPSLATWNELTFAIPSAEQTWTASGDVALDGITGANVYLAFKYAGTAGSYTWWQVDNISITSSGATDIDQINGSVLSIYPNPTNGILNFTAQNTEVTVFNLVGKEVYSATNVKSIDLSGFEKGVYMVKAKAEGASIIEKVILK